MKKGFPWSFAAEDDKSVSGRKINPESRTLFSQAEKQPNRWPLEPPRFTLRGLLFAMAVIGSLLAATKTFGGLTGTLMVLGTLAVAAHVAGNALGSRLRDYQQEKRDGAKKVSLSDEHFLPATNLSFRQSLGWPVWAGIIAGAVIGGGLGVWLFLSTEVAKATWQDTFLGALAFAVLGGMGGFLTGSFVQVLLRAWRQAHRQENGG